MLKGWAKAEGIKDALKNFSAKTKKDDTGIDWDNVEIDEDTMRLQCLFDGESGKKLKEFCKRLQAGIANFAKAELNEASKKKSKIVKAVAGNLAGDAAEDVADAAGDSGVIDKAVDKVIDAVKDKLGVKAADTAEEMAKDEGLKDAVADQAGMVGITPLGWARIAAKTVGYVLNNGEDLVNWMGEKKIKSAEDKDVVAEIWTQIENAGGEYADSEFSVRFTTDDLKWHATCLDDRKMQFDEQKLVGKVLATDTAKKFVDYCVKKWRGLASPKDYAVLPFILKNAGRLGLDGDDAFFGKVKEVIGGIDELEPKFRREKSVDEGEEPPDLEKQAEGVPDEKKGLWKKLVGIILDATKNYAADQAGSVLDELFMGNFRDAVLDVYEKKAGASLDDEEKVAGVMDDLKKFDGFEAVAKKQELHSRKDSETSTEIDGD